ncbi:hypothetical protein C1645_877345 [Glomus cerebriforme]|uniref:F-box domain-containing protein n=1 Tax=Glomus cerebriforme TaxID=658196 RepID=A0A397SWU2_9GLOM|nr:hypothetical protein C1645_877345 [Glomus cerebriforme]
MKLPTECMLKIFENFSPEYHFWDDDYKLLHKCILINREWCITAISILWREPIDWIHFSQKRDRLDPIITTYLSCLPQEIKSKLIEDGINLPLKFDEPLFDYPSFLQSLDYGALYKSVNGWLKNTNQLNELNRIYRNFQVFNSLANLFMDRCYLKRLRFSKGEKMDFILPLTPLPKADICLANLTTFMCEGCTMPEIMFAAAKICKYISEFHISCCCKDNKGLAKLVESQIVPIKYVFIKATKNEKFPFLEKALKKKAHSIKDLWIYGNCSTIDYFCNSNNLQNLIIHSSIMDKRAMERFVKSKFTQLKELEISLKVITLKQLCTLIKHTEGSFESILVLWSESEDSENLILLTETVIRYGKNLNYYEAPFSPEAIHLLPLLFQSCTKLETLHIFSNEEEEGFIYDISDIFSDLGKIVPINLQKLLINHTWDISADVLEKFLFDCSKRLKKKLCFDLNNSTSDHDLILYRYSIKGICEPGSNDFSKEYYIC